MAVAWALLAAHGMKIATLGFSLLLGTSPLIAHADISGSIDIHVTASAPGVEIGSVDVFYDQLSPYGVWVEESRVGLVFIPDDVGYIPYRRGHWAYTDFGMVWISSEPFGWATSHYGRWFFSSEFGRWVWVPDTHWGPAWVEWYEAEDTFGWVPLAPEILISYGYETPFDGWHYCPSGRLFDRNIARYYVPRERLRTLHAQARPVAQRAAFANRTIVFGPSPERLQAHRVAVQRQPIQRVAPARQLGRPTSTEAQRLTQRAQQRRPVVEQQNERRIQQRAEIRRVVEQRPTPSRNAPPARTTPAPSGTAPPPARTTPAPAPGTAPPRIAPTPPSRTAPAPTRPAPRDVRPTPDAPRGDREVRPPSPTPPPPPGRGPRPDDRAAPTPDDREVRPPRPGDRDVRPPAPPRENGRAPQRPSEPPRVAPPQRPNEPPPRVAPPQRPNEPPPRVAPPEQGRAEPRRPDAPPRTEGAPQQPPPRAQPQQPRERAPARRPPPRDKDRDERKERK